MTQPVQERAMLEVYHTKLDETYTSGPYIKGKIEYWLNRLHSEHQVSLLTQVIRPLTEEEELLPNSTHSMGGCI